MSGDLSTQQKLLIARGASLDAADPQLGILIALTSDEDAEVRRLAEETLQRIPDEHCARLLQSPAVDGSVMRYFLDPDHFRPALLPILLTHGSTPPEAVAALAGRATPEGIRTLLDHLEDLKTDALLALRRNPAYLDRQKQFAAPPPIGSAAGEPLPEADRTAALEQLRRLTALAADREPTTRYQEEHTLRNLPEAELLQLLASPSLDPSVARYFLDRAPQHLSLLPLLLGHPDTPADAIVRLAATAGPEVVPVLLEQLDWLRTPALIALRDNQTYLLWQKEPPPQGYVLEVDLLDMLIQEMKGEAPPTEDEVLRVVAELGGPDEAVSDKGGLVSKIARMKVAQRVKFALLGTREERALLIRDPSRVVCRAVLSSPKLTDPEVESFAAMKNVSQEVLRLISMSRKFMKNYTVLRCLVNNPRTPIDVSLPLLNRLLPNDLRAAAASREIPDTLRKMAKKLVEARTR